MLYKHDISSSVKETDDKFYRRLKAELTSDVERDIRSHFMDYTQLIIDMALYPDEFLMLPIYASLQKRCMRWHRSLSKEFYFIYYDKRLRNDDTMGMLKFSLVKLRSRSSDLEEVTQILQIINEIVNSREECLELMSMLPNYGDLHCFSWLLFSKDTNIIELAVELFQKLEKEKVKFI